MNKTNDFSQFFDVAPNESQFINGSTLLKMGIDNIPTLFEGLIPQVGVSAIVGASDTCKSMFLRNMAMCNAGGLAFLNRPCNSQRNRSIVVCSEDDEFAISFLLRKQNKTLQLTDEQASRITFLFDTEDFIQKLEVEMEATPADLIVIDAFGDLFDGKDLNQNSQVRAFLNKFTIMATRYKCSIVFLHHTGKRTEDLAPSKNNAIGSQGFEAKMRLVIEVRLDRTENDLRHLCIVKGNYLPQEEKKASHVIRMDENFTFTATGDRVPFEELILGSSGAPKKKSRNEPSKLNDDLHIKFIDLVFKGEKQFGKNDLNRKLMDHFDVCDKVGRRYIDYYEEKGLIQDVSTNPSRCSYKKPLLVKLNE